MSRPRSSKTPARRISTAQLVFVILTIVIIVSFVLQLFINV